MSPFIIKQLHRQRIQFSSSHFFFHDCVSQKGQKHNYRMQQHANKEISTAGLQANIGCKLWRVFFANNGFFFWSFIPETFFTAVLQCDKGLFKKQGITLPLFQSLEFTFVLRENTKKAVSLADQQWHNEEEAHCVCMLLFHVPKNLSTECCLSLGTHIYFILVNAWMFVEDA